MYLAKNAAEPEMLRVLLHRCAGAEVSRDMDMGALSVRSFVLSFKSCSAVGLSSGSCSSSFVMLLDKVGKSETT